MGVTMNKETETKNIIHLNSDGKKGDVQIADEVIAVIAGLAATEVKGVSKMSGNITKEIISKLGMKNLSKGVKVLFQENQLTVQVAIVLKYGYSIPKVSAMVQEKVKAAIENMTGITVKEVSVHIQGIDKEE